MKRGRKVSTITYYARIYYSDEGPDVFKYGVSFPDLPGCLTCGDTKEEAIEMAKEVLRLFLDVGEGDKVEINPPSRLDELELRADSFSYEDEISYEFVPITIQGGSPEYFRRLAAKQTESE